MLNYEFHKNKETYKNEYSLTGLDFDQIYFIREGLQHEIEQLKSAISMYKLEIENLSKRDANKTVEERLNLFYGTLESFEYTVQKLNQVYDVLQAK